MCTYYAVPRYAASLRPRSLPGLHSYSQHNPVPMSHRRGYAGHSLRPFVARGIADIGDPLACRE